MPLPSRSTNQPRRAISTAPSAAEASMEAMLAAANSGAAGAAARPSATMPARYAVGTMARTTFHDRRSSWPWNMFAAKSDRK